MSALSPALVSRVRGVVPSCVDWLVQQVAANAEAAYRRANPPKPKRVMPKMNSERFAAASATLGGPPSRSVSAPGSEAMDMDAEITTELDERVDIDDSENDPDDDDEIPDDEYPSSPYHRAHVFSPTAASTTTDPDHDRATAVAERLAATGRAGHGLFLVLHADDIHSTQQLLDALRDFLGTSNYYTVSISTSSSDALQQTRGWS